jgi:NADPH:quinone reductase-like Zn-dependent oxidoreductase
MPAFDAIGESYIDTLAQAVAPEGTIYLYGLLSEEANNYPVSAFFKAISLTGYMMYQMKTPERFDPMKRYVYEHLANGSFKPMWTVPPIRTSR